MLEKQILAKRILSGHSVSETKLQPKFMLADDFLDLKTMNTSIIIEQLENNIKLRDMTIEQQLKKKLLKQNL